MRPPSMTIQPSFLAALACVATLAACAAPKKATVVNPTPKEPAKTETAASPQVAKAMPDDGLRTGDLLALPKDTEYHATNSAAPGSGPGAGTVVVSPPSPPKPKPQPPKE